MGGLEAIDLTRWPVWLVFALLVANLFKEQIGSFVPMAVRDFFRHRAARQIDREEFDQEIQEALVNSRLQSQATDELRKSWREEQWVELLQRKDAWLQDILEARLVAIQDINARTLEEAVRIKHGTERTNNILTTIHIVLSKLSDRLGGRDAN